MTEFMAQIKAFIESVLARVSEHSTAIAAAQQYIVDHFGQTGLIAAYITLGILVIFVISRLVKLTFAAVKYLVVPAVVLAFLASLCTPFSFATALPVTVTVCSLVLLFKG
jgi:hypothetical protein